MKIRLTKKATRYTFSISKQASKKKLKALIERNSNDREFLEEIYLKVPENIKKYIEYIYKWVINYKNLTDEEVDRYPNDLYGIDNIIKLFGRFESVRSALEDKDISSYKSPWDLVESIQEAEYKIEKNKKKKKRKKYL